MHSASLLPFKSVQSVPPLTQILEIMLHPGLVLMSQSSELVEVRATVLHTASPVAFSH